MKIVEISASLGNDLKRYNVLEKVLISKYPFTEQISVLYGVTKPTDIVQTNAPTNILIDKDGNPIGDSETVYFGIRVYPFISEQQRIRCDNNNITYGEVFGLDYGHYFTNTPDLATAFLPEPYTGELYTQPTFVQSLPNRKEITTNYPQAMQQFINDCVFPTKPNIDIPGQTLSDGYNEFVTSEKIPYFNYEVCVLDRLNQRDARGILSLIQDKDSSSAIGFEKYMVQFDGQNLNFKFGMAVNSDFSAGFPEIPDIYLPYLYRTYGALISSVGTWLGNDVSMGVIMQCLLYDSNGNVISA